MSAVALSLLFVVFAELLNAATVLIDKYIITSTAISRPTSYAFYVGVISGIVVLILPFGLVHTPDNLTLTLSLLIGTTFITSIVFLYSALKAASATDVVPWLASITTITTFLAGSFFLQETLPRNFLYAIILFVLGMLFVGHFRFNARSFMYVFFSAILFGSSTIFLKILFGHTTFADGFFWSRMGNAVAALALLLVPENRKAIFHSSQKATHQTTYLVIVNRILGGVSFLSVLYAIKLGTVSIVNALTSLQFVFLFLLIFLLRHRIPKWYDHEFRPGHVAHKILAVVLIMWGFVVLFV